MVTPTPKPKKSSAQRGATYAEGSDTSMHGKGDRTKTSTPDSAGPETPGRTAAISKSNPKFAEGGTKRQASAGLPPRVAGGLAYRAMPGATGTGTEVIAAGEKHWRGGRKI